MPFKTAWNFVGGMIDRFAPINTRCTCMGKEYMHCTLARHPPTDIRHLHVFVSVLTYTVNSHNLSANGLVTADLNTNSTQFAQHCMYGATCIRTKPCISVTIYYQNNTKNYLYMHLFKATYLVSDALHISNTDTANTPRPHLKPSTGILSFTP